MSKTFAIIKPDAVAKQNALGSIISTIGVSGFGILEMCQVHMTVDEAKEFYAVHVDRPFYDSLCEFMSSGPCVVLALEKENAVQEWRDLIGATNPAEALGHTIRSTWGDSIDRNAVHGSDSDENAQIEIQFFFG